MIDFYQRLPEYINPIVISVGFFSIRWYSVMYLAGFAAIYSLLKYRMKETISRKIKNSKLKINSKIQTIQCKILNNISVSDLMIYLIVGLLIGARLGYVLFYDLSYFFQHPLEIFLPFRVTSYELQVTGIYGMSYYGGLIGAILAGWIFARRNSINFWQLADFIIPAIPAGYFFGRIGNFLNGELYGCVTNKFW